MFQPSIFRGYVKLPGGTHHFTQRNDHFCFAPRNATCTAGCLLQSLGHHNERAAGRAHALRRIESSWTSWKNNLGKDEHYLQGTNISHLGKRKIIFKMPFWGDMLVLGRVSLASNRFRKKKSCISTDTPIYSHCLGKFSMGNFTFSNSIKLQIYQ